MPFPIPINMDNLSDQRKAILNGLVKVIPSKHPEDRFNSITGGQQLDLVAKWAANPTYSTCESLPGFVGRQVGQSGWAGMGKVRDVAKGKNAWVDISSGKLPLPGDIYCLGGQLVLHVGVVLDAGNDAWWTADAGQGLTQAGADRANEQTNNRYNIQPSQSAAFVQRQFAGDQLMGEGHKFVHIEGWLDIDAYFLYYDPYDDL